MAGRMVEFPSNGRTIHGYLATPAQGRGPGVVVIQEWWGLVGHIKHVCDRFAAEGFSALQREGLVIQRPSAINAPPLTLRPPCGPPAVARSVPLCPHFELRRRSSQVCLKRAVIR